MSYPPICDLALIGDSHSAALVGRDGSVEWCCFHRFDARPVFARLLDRERGGHLRVGPGDETSGSRRYLPGTNILETTFSTDTGTLVVTDAFVVDRSRADGSGDTVSPHMQLVRLVECRDGEVDVRLEVSPRFDYGHTIPRLEVVADGLAVVYGGADALVIESDLPLEEDDVCGCSGDLRMRANDRRFLSITFQWPHRLDPQRVGRDTIDERLDATANFWRRWMSRLRYDGPYADAVTRSALVLKALTNAPTGAVVAAATTSLPEVPGGERNWDYRYTWLRDAALLLDALFDLGITDEGHAFMDWVERTTAGRAAELQPVYGVGGERLLPETTLDDLDGYGGARPVRIGNGAAQQFQLDVFGELADAVWRYQRHGGDVSPGLWAFVKDVADTVVERWEEPDAGIWEIRGRPRHYVSSKVFAWIALDRACRMAEDREPDLDTTTWRDTAQCIRTEVLDRGVDRDTGALIEAYDLPQPDAATLLGAIQGFLDGSDPTLAATIEAVSDRLGTDGGLVYRYRHDDGLEGDEGPFVVTSFWLVSALVKIGERDRARTLFERLLDHANDVGLLSEQVDPSTGALLGNFPQAFSHTGLIRAALDLDGGA
jgi:GH15 family glucan-1,4-alpha-glucosidase